LSWQELALPHAVQQKRRPFSGDQDCHRPRQKLDDGGEVRVALLLPLPGMNCPLAQRMAAGTIVSFSGLTVLNGSGTSAV